MLRLVRTIIVIVKTEENCRQKGKDKIIAATYKNQQRYIELNTKNLHKQ